MDGVWYVFGFVEKSGGGSCINPVEGTQQWGNVGEFQKIEDKLCREMARSS